jgi:hypothetical protein
MAVDAMKTNDIFLTSSGVGHHWRPGYYFPSSNFRSVVLNPLPPKLAKSKEITCDEHFTTSTGVVHDQKDIGLNYGNLNPLYKKAPASYNVDYNKDLHEKLQPGGWRRPLTMGYQTSETHEQFRLQPGISEPTELTPNPRGYLLHGHLTEGPSQKVLPTTKNEKLRGRPFYPRDKAVMDLNDPYLTTNNKVHRRFTAKELDSYPHKDNVTFWECEEYPKAWGHGSKHNPLPKDSVAREPLPMRDTMVFKTATRVPRIPHAFQHVPHSGLKSEYDDRYLVPSDPKRTQAVFCPLDQPYLLPAPATKATYSAPHMYRTEYNNIGSNHPITI